MSEEIKGKCYQEHEPTPDNPCEIKTILCNDIEIPVEFLKQNFVIVDGKKYIELQQQNKKYKEVIDKLKEWINIVQQNKDNKHLETFISTDELDELLDILNEVSVRKEQ